MCVERNSGKRHAEKISNGGKLTEISDYARKHILSKYGYLCVSAEWSCYVHF